MLKTISGFNYLRCRIWPAAAPSLIPLRSGQQPHHTAPSSSLLPPPLPTRGSLAPTVTLEPVCRAERPSKVKRWLEREPVPVPWTRAGARGRRPLGSGSTLAAYRLMTNPRGPGLMPPPPPTRALPPPPAPRSARLEGGRVGGRSPIAIPPSPRSRPGIRGWEASRRRLLLDGSPRRSSLCERGPTRCS